MREPIAQRYRVLCYVNHFYGINAHFEGKSSAQESEYRKQILNQCLNQLRKIDLVDIKICGIEGSSLVEIDVNFPKLKDNPTFLVYESIHHMIQYVDQYDYFINVEDDILVPTETFQNVIEFDKFSFPNEILLPNRLETDETGYRYCVDFFALDFWIQQWKKYQGRQLRVHANPHSAILIMSREKFKYAISNIDVNFRGILLTKAMASAYAHFHSPFALYRSFDDANFHYVIHLDKWLRSPKIFDRSRPFYSPGPVEPPLQLAVPNKLSLRDFIPPIASKGYRFLKRYLSN